MRNFILVLLTLLVAACTPQSSSSLKGDGLAGFEARDGFIDLYVNPKTNVVLAKLPVADEDGISLRAIHSARLTAGLGSNPVGLDRGWGESGRVVVFRRLGNTIVLEEENLKYRANPDNPLEARAVRESFARSFLATFPIRRDDADGIVVDFTEFLTADSLNLVQYLKEADQGAFTIAKDRTLVDTTHVFAFPDNIELDVFFTLTSSKPGGEVASTAASGRDATLIQHHSFVRLPDSGYTPLLSDPRAGAVEEVHYDYSAPLSGTIETRFARRFRLEKDADGTVINPIIFYIDGGAPEPIRSALVDGARWWEEAFEAAGYPGGYRVEILPEDAHPLDIRYNVVQWVHRQTRGWSYGGGVSDPRTGEMLKGHVNLGSLRVRQDRMIFEGLLGAEKTDSGDADDPVQLALARIRQLSAHEVGHALGFAHNFAASSDDKASVMDYPAPDVRLVDGALDVSNAYGVGIGEWDIFTTAWLYSDFSEAQRDSLVEAAYASGLTYVADMQGRGVGSAHPDGSVWDNGSDAVATLDEVMAVRAYALERFGLNNLRDGAPVSELNKTIVPIYLYHRYQTAAAAKSIGGMTFAYGINGDATPSMEILAPDIQRAALQAVLRTIEPAALDIPDSALEYLTPALGSWSFADSDREMFRASAAPAFDTVAAAETAADLTFDVLLHPQRAARLVEFSRRDEANPSLAEVLATIRRTVMTDADTARTVPIQRAVQAQFAYGLMELADSQAGPLVQADANTALRDMVEALQSRNRKSSRSVNDALVEDIYRFLNRPATAKAPKTAAKALPPGSPIGSDCFHCEGTK